MEKNKKYLSTLNSLYVLSIIFPVILARKLVAFPILGIAPASIIFTANYFILLAIITNVYGYKKAQWTIFNGLLIHTIFTVTMQIIISFSTQPTPVSSIYSGTNDAYSLIFGRGLYMGWFYVLFLLTLFATINNKLFEMLMIKTPKLCFWIKLMIANSISILGMTIVISLISIYQNSSNALSLNLYAIEFYKTIILKFSMLLIFSIPGTLLFYIVKRTDNKTNDIGASC